MKQACVQLIKLRIYSTKSASLVNANDASVLKYIYQINAQYKDQVKVFLLKQNYY